MLRTLVVVGLLWPASSAWCQGPKLSKGEVLVEICEDGVPVKEEWPATVPAAAETYTARAFGFFQLPHKYIDTGIRADRPVPFLFRASALIDLPPGKHRLLLRSRGAGRLSIDDQIVLTTPFPPPITDGHTPMPTKYLDLCPDFRFAPPGNWETWTIFTSAGNTHRIVLESVVGGKRGKGTLRPEVGETVVAISLEGANSFRLLAPKQVVPYTDAGWKEYMTSEKERIARLEKEKRAAAFAQHAADWQQRHDRGRQWLDNSPETPVPLLPPGLPAYNAIDHFLGAKIAAARKEAGKSKGTVDFAREIKPLLEAKCFSCHQGKKVKGGLRLDQAEAALAGGNSDRPAIVPKHPEKSELIARIISTDPDAVMPPQGERLSAQETQLLKQWIKEGPSWSMGPVRKLTPLTDDLSFLRRVTLDTVGVVPTPDEIAAFLADRKKDKRQRVIDRLLADPRWADHWVGYWQDVLAENPNILNPTLNNTGPYRWWIYEAFLDNKPMDVFVTELVRMRGSHYQGGPAGFAMASENDVPMAEKAAIVSSAFLGVQMKCARCHDAPGHKSTQKELFQLAAMLGQGPIAVPKTSSVPKDKIHGLGRKPLIQVTLNPGTKVAPAWPFAELAREGPAAKDLAARDRLAALITAPENERFAQVLANRLWKRYMGRGLVEPVDDWEKGEATHPELLRYLGRELVRSGYNLKHLARLILQSHAYQRAVDPDLKEPDPLYTAHARRRLSAEQVVDSLFLAAGKALDTEEVNLDIDGGRDMKNSISLGKPRRAWQFASTSNERDRPSLSLPRVQAVVDVLEAFGWRSSRQFPLSDREIMPNVLQPAILANGTMSTWLTRLSDDHALTPLALKDQPADALVDQLFLQILTRKPSSEEREAMLEHLLPGYDTRRLANPPPVPEVKRERPKFVSWSNHLTPEANQIKLELETAARRGALPTNRLDPEWRRRLEDVVWTLLNAPEFVFVP